jgi:hypothetical protein
VPFLRVIRDKRGYETTYLMHWQREGTRQRSRILYVFRTPGGVRVGRESFAPEVLRQIEGEHPDIAFDWKSVFANQQIVESTSESRRPRKRKPGGEESDAPAPVKEQTQIAVPPPRPSIPSTLQGATPDEQIAFLNQLYPAVRDQISQRTADPARVDALLALAERLNPAAWTDADQIAEGLVRAAEALERLSHVFSRRRRRRRSSKAPADTAAPDVSSSTDT